MFRPGFVGSEVCAYDRARMLAGAPADLVAQQCSDPGPASPSLLPADVDGPTPPAAGSPGYIVNYGSSRLNRWKFHVDWNVPAASSLSGPTPITVAPFTGTCAR